MKNAVSKLLIGASIAAGVSAIASAPAQAISFTFNNPNEISTYTGGSDGKFIKKDTAAAVKALTDKDSSSNVELWYSSENPTSNVDFTATEGKYKATVSSVTAADWNNFQDQWLNDLLSTYTPFQSVWKSFATNTKTAIKAGLPSLGMGDPNIGGFQFGENGGVELKLVGHMDVKTQLLTQINTLLKNPLLPSTQKNDLNKLKIALNSYNGLIAASEIAKVVTGDKTYYAYGFDPTASGITASDDGKSYNAIYTWKTQGYVPPKATPEPSVMLGMLGVAGIFAVQRKRKKASV